MNLLDPIPLQKDPGAVEIPYSPKSITPEQAIPSMDLMPPQAKPFQGERTAQELKEFGTITTPEEPTVFQRLGLGPIGEVLNQPLEKYGVRPKMGILNPLGVLANKESTISKLIAGVLPSIQETAVGPQGVMDKVVRSIKQIPTAEDPEETTQKALKGEIGSMANLALAPLVFGTKPLKMLGSGVKQTLRGVDQWTSSNPLWKPIGQMGETLWDKAKQPINYLIDPSKSIITPGGGIEKIDNLLGSVPSETMAAIQKSGKFLSGGPRKIQEWLQPAIERLNPRQQEVFRYGRAMENLFVNEKEQLGKDLTKLDLPDKLDVLRGLRGEVMGSLSNPAQEVLRRSIFRTREHKLAPEFLQKADEEFSKLLTKMLKAPQDVLTDPIARQLLEDASQVAKNPRVWERFFTTEGLRTRQALKKIIENPAVDEPIAIMARSVYELPATTPEEAAKAARTASNAWITRQLQSLKGADAVLSPVPKEGYVKIIGSVPKNQARPGEIVWGGLKGQYIQKDAGLELTALRDMEKFSHGWLNRFVTSPWKTMKIIMSPAAQIRNTFTNILLNDIGGMPFYRMDIYSDAIKGMAKGSAEWKDFIARTGGGGTFSRNDLASLEGIWKYDTPWYDIPYKFLDMASAGPKSLYNANEQVFKFAHYLHSLEQGVPKQRAAWEALKPTFNYGEVTRPVAAARSTLMPFATWASKVIPYTFEQAVKHPLRVGKWFAFFHQAQKYAMEQAGMSEQEWEEFRGKWPEYMQNGQYLLLPWRDSRDRLNMVDMTYIIPGLGDMTQMTGSGIWQAIFQHPATTLPGQLLANQRFTGEPIRYDWQPWEVRRAKDLSHIWESLMPSWLGPYGADYKRYTKALSEQPGAQTVGQAIASQFGMRIQPLDEEKIYPMAQAMRRIHLTEITNEMKKDLRLATTDQERDEIIERFAKWRQDFLEEQNNPRKSWVDRLKD